MSTSIEFFFNNEKHKIYIPSLGLCVVAGWYLVLDQGYYWVE
jgi:hypothetical protein